MKISKKLSKDPKKRNKVSYRNASLCFLKQCRSIEKPVAKLTSCSALYSEGVLSKKDLGRIKRLDNAINDLLINLYLKVEAMGHALDLFFSEQGEILTQIKESQELPKREKITSLNRRNFVASAECMVRGMLLLLHNYADRCEKEILDLILVSLHKFDVVDRLIVQTYNYEEEKLSSALEYIAGLRRTAKTLKNDSADAITSLDSLRVKLVMTLNDKSRE